MARSASSNQTNATEPIRNRITKAKTSAAHASTQKRLSVARNVVTKGKQSKARARIRPSVRRISKARPHSSTTDAKRRSVFNSSSKNRSSIRTMYAQNNSAVRHGRSSNASQGTSRTMKSMSSNGVRKKTTRCITNRLNAKRTTIRTKSNSSKNNNRQRQQQLGHEQKKRKKSATSNSSMISTTTSNSIRPDEICDRESDVQTNE